MNFVGINFLILSPTRPFSFVLLQIASAYFQDHIHSAVAIDVHRYSLATIFQRVHLPCCRCAPAQRRSSASLDSSVPHSDGHPDTQAAAAGQGALLLQAGFHRFFQQLCLIPLFEHLQQENTFYTSLQGRTFPPAVFTFPWIQNDCMAFFQYFHCFRLMQVCLPCLPIIKPFPICLDRFQLILLDFLSSPSRRSLG